MSISLKGRSFLTLKDFTPLEIRYLLDLAHDLKSKKRAGIRNKLLDGKNIVLLFDKTSTRTRCAFEVAAFDEGAHVTFLSNSQMGKKESLEDTAKVLGRFYDGIEFRGYEHKTVENLAKYSGIPVWNGLTDIDHPTQVLADFMTIEEHIHKPLNKIKVVYVGDTRNCIGNSFLMGCAKMGMHYVSIAPKSLHQDKKLIDEMIKVAEETGAILEFTDNIENVKGADVIYTDIWASMGEEEKMPERVKLLESYRVNMSMIKKTENPDVIFMHCLPSYHDYETTIAKQAKENLGLDIQEVTDEVFRSKYSVAFDQAENRLHTIKAIMVATL